MIRHSPLLKIGLATVPVEFTCQDAATGELLERNFGAMAAEFDRPEISYTLSTSENGAISVSRTLPAPFRFESRHFGELINHLEADLLVQVQLARPALLFLHAAVVELGRVAHVLAGKSGAGKSTLTWSLVQSGFAYVSDELAPIDRDTGRVYAYPHALCLKREPAGFERADSDAFVTQRGTHVPFRDRLSAEAAPHPIGKLFLVEYSSDRASPKVEAISRASASYRLYPTVLNALSHEKAGLTALARLTANHDCYEVGAAGLGETAQLVRDVCASRSGLEPDTTP